MPPHVPMLDSGLDFPPLSHALEQPNGLLAIGGDLSPQRLLAAYRRGIFPWFNDGEPILWWSPDPRCVFRSAQVHLSRRFLRSLRTCTWSISADRDFTAVLAACAQTPRAGQRGTWITPQMQAAYSELHRLGFAHSIEVRAQNELVGGLYGVRIGRMFFAESMFSARSDASKVALAALAARLCDWGWPLIDAQIWNSHLASLGAEVMARDTFVAQVERLCALPGPEAGFAQAFASMEAQSLTNRTLRASL